MSLSVDNSASRRDDLEPTVSRVVVFRGKSVHLVHFRFLSFTTTTIPFILVPFQLIIRLVLNDVEVARFKSRSNSRRDRQCRSLKIKAVSLCR